ncbi:hypothetical protein CYK72_12850 [Clostridium perfringens]|uniref:site-specific DNA-methyltransferase n=1 Tax=Clostridium perfringens TaxID=1502 RepID=UPI000D71AB45|nr:site-specific DNA-methyltransferase [Clostridium perfringens]PWX46825.1 hypothetical protein CYK72_12850 [Clostridium perfringens]
MLNLSNKKRKEMIDFLEILRQEHTDDKSIRAINQIENELTEKKYGLVWEEYSEKVDEMLVNNIPIFKEIEDKKILVNEEKPFNFLLEGDNLHSLTLLEKTHTGKVDVIYIDPPYNTGNKDFIYDDKFIDKTDGYIHSKWLSFMSKRLEIAKKLLKDDGIIFISIDDNEQAQLKLLCDNIFGEENLIATICVELSKTQGMKVKSAQEGRIVKNHEYIYVYSKNLNFAYKNRQPLYDKGEIWDNHFNKFIILENEEYISYSITDYVKKYSKDIYELFETHNLLNKNKITSASIENGIILEEKIRKYFYEEIPHLIYQEMACSIKINSEIKKSIEEKGIVKYKKYLLTISSGGKLRQYRNLLETLNISDEYNPKLERVTIRGALWKGFYSDMMNLSKEGKIDFKNGKKPVRLIKQLNKYINRKDSIILDFFAGSGTTGHAILELNKDDGGNRRYILCTNNENNICENITYKRLENIQEELPHNVKYFKTEFIPKIFDGSHSIKDKMLENIIPLIELEYGISIDNVNNIIISDEEQILKILETSDKDITLYVTSDIMLSQKEKSIAKRKNIRLVEIPEYYFKSELREVGEI